MQKFKMIMGGLFLSFITQSLPHAAFADEANPKLATTKSAEAKVVFHKPFAEIISRHANDNHVPAALAAAVVEIESRFNPRVANHGAMGLMQIKPQTARGVGFSGPASALYIPEVNLTFGIRYLAQAYRMADGDTCGTLMRYQSGLGTSHMSRANRAYCAKAKAIMG